MFRIVSGGIDSNRRLPRGSWVVAFVGIAGFAAAAASAQDAGGGVPAGGPAAVTTAAIEARPAAKEGPKLPAASAGKDGFSLQSESGDHKLRIGGYVQADTRLYLSDDAETATNTFLLRRVRPVLRGTVAKHFDFYFQPDFAEGKVALYDAYGDLRFSRALRFRFGKSKPPVGLERLHSGAALTFVERALPTQLVPNRDVGVSILGEIAGGALSYQVGLVNGGPDGSNLDIDSNDSKDVVARLQASPFKKRKSKWVSGLTLAFAGSSGKQRGTLPSFKSGGQLSFFSYASKAKADGSRTRFSPQGSWYGGPLSLFGEFVRSEQKVTNGTVTADIANRAWQIAGGVVLTGEPASAGGVEPAKAFDRAKGTWGAVELVARYNTLRVDEGAFSLGLADGAVSAREAKALAFGLNWYLTQNLKYVVSFERTTFEGGAEAGDRNTENALFLRAQIRF